MYKHVTQLVAQEGLVGLQKLEAQGVLQPDFARRVGRTWNVNEKDKVLSSAVSQGIGRHSNLEQIQEMIEWLRDDDYLIDYGILTVSLALSEKSEGVPTLEESKFYQILCYFREQMDGEDDIFCTDFLLDYVKYFSPRMKEWLFSLRSAHRELCDEDMIVVETSVGYSYVYRSDIPEAADLKEEEMLYTEHCSESGMHYNRYHGFCCCD